MRINYRIYLNTILLSVQIIMLQLLTVENSAANPIAMVIDIDSADTLQLIGRNADFPYDGHYRFIENIDASNFTKPITVFNGTLDGQDKIISNLPCCLIQKLTDNAVVKNITIRHAYIHKSYCSAMIAGNLNEHAMISFIAVYHSLIYIDNNNRKHEWSHHAGIIAEIMINWAQIKNTMSYNSSIFSEHEVSCIGGVAGLMRDDAKSINNTIDFCNIATAGGSSSAGGIAGLVIDRSVSDSDSVINSNILTSGHNAHAGIEMGRAYHNVQIKRANLVNSKAITTGIDSHAAIGIGGERYYINATISNTVAINCHATAESNHSYASIWGVGVRKIRINNSTAINCTAFPEPSIAQHIIRAPALPYDTSFPWIIPLSTVGITAIALLVGRSFYGGYTRGDRGLALAVYPVRSCAKSITYLCRIVYNHFAQPEGARMESAEFETDNDKATLLY